MVALVFPLNYFKPRPYQKEVFAALDRGIKRVLLVWGRQMGKDTLCWVACVGQAMKHPGNYFYVFPTKEEARRALWEKIDRDGKALLSCIPESRLIKKSQQEMLVELRSGADGRGKSTIRIVGLDHNPDSIRGITPRGVVFSEFGYQDPDVYKVILPALQQHPDAWVIYNSTPNGKNHLYNLYMNTLASPSWFVSLKQILNPDKPGYVKGVLTPEQIRMFAAENNQTDEEVEQEYGCSWDIGKQGAVLANFIEIARKQGRIGIVPYNPTKIVDTFHDLGGNNPHVIWFRQTRERSYDYIDYEYAIGQDLWDIASILRERGYRYGTHYLPHDGNNIRQQQMVTDQEVLAKCLKNMGVSGNVETCPRLGLKTTEREVKADFHKNYFDAEKCKRGLEDLEQLSRSWDKRRKVFLDDIRDNEFKHSFDALGTSVAARLYKSDLGDNSSAADAFLRKTSYKDWNPND